ncbi:amidohydrolase [Alishewanella sp. d11]|uniref:amidohydrolase n=1 Tax=Alishewanella sp. d11 TaxID=3414030 RepID=UPI003BF8DBEF
MRLSVLGVCAGVLLSLLGCDSGVQHTSSKPLADDSAQQSSAYSLYYGGDILTMAEDSPSYVEAVLVKEGTVVFTGTKAAAEQFATQPVRYVNLQGQALLPGFIDAHSHVFAVGLQASVPNLLPPPDGQASTVEQLIALLTASLSDESYQPFVAKTGAIIGFGYDDAELDRYPTAADLDRVSTELPILIMHTSGHLSVVNSKALAILNIHADTPDPEGGIIRRKAGSTVPNGVLEETAHFMALGQLLGQMDLELQQAMFKKGQQLYARYGYTTAQEGRASADSIAMMILAAEQGDLLIDVVAYPDIVSDAAAMSSPYYQKHYKHKFRIGGAKLTLDGSPQGKTAWLSHPYHHPPEGQTEDYAGYPVFNDAQVRQYVDLAYSNNWQLLVHANGDAAIDQMLTIFAEATAKYGMADRRNVLIHGQTLRADQIEKIKTLGVFPSLFPMHTFYWGDWHAQSVLGEQRAQFISPTKAVLDAGLMFTSHHDAPVALPSSLRVLHATVNRVTRSGKVLGPDQRVDTYTALKAMTHWAAYQHFEENFKGMIKPGYQADFIVIDRNPLKVDPMQLIELKITQTISAGQPLL